MYNELLYVIHPVPVSDVIYCFVTAVPIHVHAHNLFWHCPRNKNGSYHFRYTWTSSTTKFKLIFEIQQRKLLHYALVFLQVQPRPPTSLAEGAHKAWTLTHALLKKTLLTVGCGLLGWPAVSSKYHSCLFKNTTVKIGLWWAALPLYLRLNYAHKWRYHCPPQPLVLRSASAYPLYPLPNHVTPTSDSSGPANTAPNPETNSISLTSVLGTNDQITLKSWLSGSLSGDDRVWSSNVYTSLGNSCMPVDPRGIKRIQQSPERASA